MLTLYGRAPTRHAPVPNLMSQGSCPCAQPNIFVPQVDTDLVGQVSRPAPGVHARRCRTWRSGADVDVHLQSLRKALWHYAPVHVPLIFNNLLEILAVFNFRRIPVTER